MKNEGLNNHQNMAPIFVNDPDQTSQVPVSLTATPPSLTNRQQSHQTFPTALAGFHCSLVASESDWLTGPALAGNQVRLLVLFGWMGLSEKVLVSSWCRG